MYKQQRRIVGVDLGTTYTSVSHVNEYGKPEIILNRENEPVTPSVVFFEGENVIVGEVAKESAKLFPDDVVSFVKRSMGEPNFLFEHNNQIYRAEEISAFILRKVIQDAEVALEEEIRDVVITCPAYFGINEREATQKAGEIAGYNVRQIINEPTAAAIAYCNVYPITDQVVLVYDLGGGTFDITMIDIQSDSIEVICTGGDHNLGGKDWDDRIVGYLVDEFTRATQTDEDILEDIDTCQDLQLSAEKTKKILSQRDRTSAMVTHGGERVKVEISRDKFEEISRDLLERTIYLTQDMLNEARKKGYHKFDQIVLVGGATRMPQVTSRIGEEFSMEPRIFDPDEAVSKGAAIFGWKLFIQDGLIKRVAEKTGKEVEQIDEVSDEEVKTALDEAEEYVAKDTGFSVNDIKRSRMRIRNVTSKSFGVIAEDENEQEHVYNLILKNSTVPIITTSALGTTVENQDKAFIQIMENESSSRIASVDEALEISTAVLELPSGLKADSPIEITFKLNEEGRLEINAMEKTHKRVVTVSLETRSVIYGKDLEEAKERRKTITVS